MAWCTCIRCWKKVCKRVYWLGLQIQRRAIWVWLFVFLDITDLARPALPPPVQGEYNGEDVQEASDPTRQEEEEFEAKLAEEAEGEDDDED